MWNKSTNYFTTKKTFGSSGKSYDSKFERAYGEQLEMRKKAKDIVDFETHVRIPLEVNGYVVCDYYIDFVIYHLDGTTEYTETKGVILPAFRLKWKLFCALYEDKPNVKISLVMQGKKGYNPRLRKVRT